MDKTIEKKNIEDELKNSNNSLSEIKADLSNMEKFLEDMGDEVVNIEVKLDSPLFGLREIIRKVSNIENSINRLLYGLKEYENGKLCTKLDEDKENFFERLTSGPIVTDSEARSIIIKILNNRTDNMKFIVDIWNLDICPKVIFQSILLEVNSNCSVHVIFDIHSKAGSIVNYVSQYEVEFCGVKPGVYCWTSTRKESAEEPINNSQLISANTVTHNQLLS